MFAATATKETPHRRDRARHLEDARRNGKAVVGDLDSAAHAVGKDVREYIEDALDAAGENISHAKEKITGAAEKLSGHISEKPLSSAAIAMGVGVLLGTFFRRR